MAWNWQRSDWPNFTWDKHRFQKAEEQFLVGKGVYAGIVRHLGLPAREQLTIEPKPGSWERRSSAGGPISLCRATAPHFAQWVIAQYSPRRRKQGGRPRLTGMNCRF